MKSLYRRPGHHDDGGPGNEVRGTMKGEWNEKYWDMVCNIYLTPQYMGWKPIKRAEWKIEDKFALVPVSKIEKGANALYSRRPLSKASDIRNLINHKEEILNHVFNLTLAIASDELISRLLVSQVGIEDTGPFVSLGREIKERYALPDNMTQQDGLFVSDKSIIGTELKLGSKSSPGQIMKYIALMLCEEQKRNRRLQLGLLFIVPKNAVSLHWSHVGLSGPRIDQSFLARLSTIEKRPLNSAVAELLFGLQY